jgi:hypothetical protein
LEFDLGSDSFLLSLKADHEAGDQLFYRDVTHSPDHETSAFEHFAQLKMYHWETSLTKPAWKLFCVFTILLTT